MGRKLTPRCVKKVTGNRSSCKKTPTRKKHTRKKHTRNKIPRKKRHSNKHKTAGLRHSPTPLQKCMRACDSIWSKGSKKHTDCSFKCYRKQDILEEKQFKQLHEDRQLTTLAHSPVTFPIPKSMFSGPKPIGKWYFWNSTTSKYMPLTNTTTVFDRIMDRMRVPSKSLKLHTHIEHLANNGLFNVGIPIKYDKKVGLNSDTGKQIGNIGFIKPSTACPSIANAKARLAFASALNERLGIDSKSLNNLAESELYSKLMGKVDYKGRAYIGELQLIDPNGSGADSWTPSIQIIFSDTLPIKQIANYDDAVNWCGTEKHALIKERTKLKS